MIVHVPGPQFHVANVEVTTVPKRHCGSVKKWVKDKYFGFITLMMAVTTCSSIGKSWLLRGCNNTMSYDTEHDDGKRNYRARHCIVISSSGGGGGTFGDGGDDVFIHHQQPFDTRDTEPFLTDNDNRKENTGHPTAVTLRIHTAS